MKLRHYWFIVCLIIAWIASEGSQEWKKDHSEPSLKECDERSFVLNTCEEQCECNNGKLTSCYRVRKEFTEMTIEERKRYINTYKLASVHPLFKKDYEKMVRFTSTFQIIFFMAHRQSFSHGIGGFWSSLKTFCAESTIVLLYPTGTGAKWPIIGGENRKYRTFGTLEITDSEGMETRLMASAWRTDLSARTNGVS